MSVKVFIVAGPSGVGKNHIIREVLEKFSSLTILPTYTTRPAREDDKESKSRICVEEKDFLEMIRRGELLEWSQYCEFYYGKKKSDFDDAFAKRKKVITDIDVQGLHLYKDHFGSGLISIFVTYEDLKFLSDRIRKNRPDTSEEDIQNRLERAKVEMLEKEKYDYCIVNIEGKPEIAVKKVIEIVEKYM